MSHQPPGKLTSLRTFEAVALGVAVALTACHLNAGKLRLLDGTPRSRWLSLAAGVLVSDVFVHLLQSSRTARPHSSKGDVANPGGSCVVARARRAGRLLRVGATGTFDPVSVRDGGQPADRHRRRAGDNRARFPRLPRRLAPGDPPPGRRLRAAMWFFWLRRPIDVAAGRSWALLKAAPATVWAPALFEALARGWWVAAARELAPPWLEAQLQRLDGERPSGTSRLPV